MFAPWSWSAQLKTRNVFLITTDGLRWQEVFTGAEELLLNQTNGNVKDVPGLQKRFWRATPVERRQALLPFLWSEIAAKGQLYGNRHKGSDAHITNTNRFSYPGYNEFLTGAADDARITSNSKLPNPNTNVFEWLNGRRGFTGKVGAVVNWDVIPWILNTGRSQLPVWTGYSLPPGTREIEVSPVIAELRANTPTFWSSVILDAITAQAAVDYVKQARPRAMYVAFGETDEWAHEGRYDHYLTAAHHVDRFVQRLWQTVQAMPQYRNQTSFIITTDHGRGSGTHAWRDHGAKVDGAENIWVAVLGPDTPPLGEISNGEVVTQAQVAATVAALLGLDYHAAFPHKAPPIRGVIGSASR